MMTTGSGTPLRYYAEIVDPCDGHMRVYDTSWGPTATRQSPVTPERIVAHIRLLIQFDPHLIRHLVD